MVVYYSPMSTEELWLHLQQLERKQVLIFGKSYISISHDDFRQFEHCFKPQFALLNSHKNYRSNEWYWHVHAIVRPTDVQVHIDRGNPNKHILLNIPHGLFDVLPYFTWCLVTWNKPL